MGSEASLGGGQVEKRLLVTHHGIEDREYLAHASRDGHFFLLATFQQLLILWFQDRVVVDPGQGGHI